MKIALVQYNPVWEDKEQNKKKIKQLLDEYKEPADIIIFPEMTLTGFTMRTAEMSELTKGDTFTFFANLAKEKNCTVLAGLIERSGSYIFNSLLHINWQGDLMDTYHKIHPYTNSGEDKHYKAGENPVTAMINGWKVGLSICYDLRFPELYRFYGKQKAGMIVNIANWPVPRIEHYKTLLKARAIENQCYVAGVNRIGEDPEGHKYNGFSSVFDPSGNEIITCENAEMIIAAEINHEAIEKVRTQLPFLNDIKMI